MPVAIRFELPAYFAKKNSTDSSDFYLQFSILENPWRFFLLQLQRSMLLSVFRFELKTASRFFHEKQDRSCRCRTDRGGRQA